MIGNNNKIVCPYCLEAGHVFVRPVKRKKGISGGKATGALLTGGLSLFAVGLSRKERTSLCRCYNCNMRWDA